MTIEQLLEAYRRTSFLVEIPGETLCIRIDHVSTIPDDLLANEGVHSWAYITAWNPGSVPLSEGENMTQARQLESEVRQAGYKFFRGQGVGTGDEWPPEPSLLILGIAAEDAMQLGRKFGQIAIVTGRRGGPAQLDICKSR